MPRLLLTNVPTFYSLGQEAVEKLYDTLDAVGVEGDRSEIIISNSPAYRLPRIGSLAPAGVHAEVMLWTGRTREQKAELAATIQGFLNQHDLGVGTLITFREVVAEDVYPGGKPA